MFQEVLHKSEPSNFVRAAAAHEDLDSFRAKRICGLGKRINDACECLLHVSEIRAAACDGKCFLFRFRCQEEPDDFFCVEIGFLPGRAAAVFAVVTDLFSRAFELSLVCDNNRTAASGEEEEERTVL